MIVVVVEAIVISSFHVGQDFDFDFDLCHSRLSGIKVKGGCPPPATKRLTRT